MNTSKTIFGFIFLASRHMNTIGDDTLNLVQTLFEKYNFNGLIIESIPYSSGESPKWFLDEAKNGKSDKFIKGGESASAVILADEKKIPFFAGEPDHQDIYRGLKERGYTDEDVMSWYKNQIGHELVADVSNEKVAVVYGAGPFLTLRKSFDASFGEPAFIEDRQ